jgi:hypothetical protein
MQLAQLSMSSKTNIQHVNYAARACQSRTRMIEIRQESDYCQEHLQCIAVTWTDDMELGWNTAPIRQWKFSYNDLFLQSWGSVSPSFHQLQRPKCRFPRSSTAKFGHFHP